MLPPDFDRRIDLPGAGLCPRPVDIDRSRTGFEKLVALRVYSVAQGKVIDGEAEADEVFIVLMRGRAEIAVDQAGDRVGRFALAVDGGSRAVYLPPHASYQLTALADCDIAYARVQPPGTELKGADDFVPVEGSLMVAGHAAGMDLVLQSLPAGSALALVGQDGSAPERFLHIRSDATGIATVSGEQLADWTSAALAEGEPAMIEVEEGPIDILMIAASTH